MGDPKGFLKYERKTAGYRPAEERVRDWREFGGQLPEQELREQGARCMDCGTPFCHTGCPLGNLIPDWNDLLYRGKIEVALERLHRTNNFPEFTGRVCPAPCEEACVLGINAPPVTIKSIEQHIIDYGFEHGLVQPRPPETRTGKRVAVVGSGPAGLAAAQQLNRAGHQVVVFERDDKIGGLLVYGIPDFKLGKEIVKRRVALMEQEGISFRVNSNVGGNVPIAEILSYDAVCLCGGSTQPRDLPVPGRELKGVHFAMEFLTQQNRRGAGEAIPEERAISAAGKRVIVLGGGDTGSDCLGTSHRQGAASVKQFELLTQPPDAPENNPVWPFWPNVLRTSSSQEEGGERDWCVNTQEFVGDEKGNLTALRATRVRFGEPDENGRRPMEEIPGGDFEEPADLVLLALGFVHPEREGMLDKLGVELDERGNVKVNENYQTSVDKVFSAGDMRRGQSLVVWAILEGREAARGIDEFLMGRGSLPGKTNQFTAPELIGSL